MSIQDIGAIGELVGAILLFLSIMYLALQVAETKKQMKAATNLRTPKHAL